MRLSRRCHPFSIPLLLLFSLLVTHVVSQNLPKLDNTAAGVQAAATSTAAAVTSKIAAKTSAKAAAKSTEKPTATTAKASSTDALGLTGLPKLAGDDYPPPTVPPTADAPFMQKSSLPEGTVFICVGAALGFIGFLVLAWRGLVAWSLHRSVRKAAIAQSSKYSQVGDPRANIGKPKSPYFSPGPGSTLTLDHLGTSGKGGSKQQSAHNSLFFSPTAGAGMHSPNNKGSGYLPAGYYAAGSSAPGSGSGMTHIGGGGIGLSNLRPESHRYSRARSAGPSPPGSPSLPPSRGADSLLGGRDSAFGGRLSTQGLTMHASDSSLNLAAPPGQGRAPSAYLEDLFENHPPGRETSEEQGRRSSRY
ncbi:hypothetical protein MMC28_008343 [Mycoblastus sanguinarius]|nr:hypothetical protein [Mycoblastus sanguinarius]